MVPNKSAVQAQDGSLEPAETLPSSPDHFPEIRDRTPRVAGTSNASAAFCARVFKRPLRRLATSKTRAQKAAEPKP
jgi:hypothetical protein